MSGRGRFIWIGSCTVGNDAVLLVVLGFQGVFRDQVHIADIADEIQRCIDIFLHHLEANGEKIIVEKHSPSSSNGRFVVQSFDEVAGHLIVLTQQREKLRNDGSGPGAKEIKYFASRSETYRNFYHPILSYFSGGVQKISLCAPTGDRRLTPFYFRLYLKQIGIKGMGQAMGAKVANAFFTFLLVPKYFDGPPVTLHAEKNYSAKSKYGPDSLYPCGNHSPGPFGVRVPGQLGVRGYRVHKCCTRWPHMRGGKCLVDRRRHIKNQDRKQNKQSGHAVNLTENRDGRQGPAGGADRATESRSQT